MISLAGTRLSEQPIHRTSGDCCCASLRKKSGRSWSIRAAHLRLFSSSRLKLRSSGESDIGKPCLTAPRGATSSAAELEGTKAMTAVEVGRKAVPVEPGLLDRSRIIADATFNRWLVPPAALAIHLCIGMAYGFSVFWLPLSRAIGITKSAVCKDMSLLGALTTTTCDWRVSDVTVMYTLFFVFLGLSAALFGGWLERAGPRKAGVASAMCWCIGLLISACGVIVHQLW